MRRLALIPMLALVAAAEQQAVPSQGSSVVVQLGTNFGITTSWAPGTFAETTKVDIYAEPVASLWDSFKSAYGINSTYAQSISIVAHTKQPILAGVVVQITLPASYVDAVPSGSLIALYRRNITAGPDGRLRVNFAHVDTGWDSTKRMATATLPPQSWAIQDIRGQSANIVIASWSPFPS